MENPDILLDNINLCLENGGTLILTTDNISSIYNISKILKGESPNQHLTESKIFFNGPWKPHIRLYSKNDLKFLLNYSGFKIVEHKFFDNRGHQYLDKKLKRTKISLKQHIVEFFLYPIFPYLKDHHLIIAKKVVDYEQLSKLRPLKTQDEKKWIDIRKNWQDYKIFKITE